MAEVFSAAVAGLFAVLVVLVQRGRAENRVQHNGVETRLARLEERLAAHVVWEEQVKYITRDDLDDLVAVLREVSRAE